jgi:uncharacterized protein YdeI (YjbR/CyaY-like superfamily)
VKKYPDVDAYLAEAEMWPDEIRALRPILLDCDVTEEVKWGKPCYSHDGDNIVLIQEFKQFLALMFFKGALLDDPEGVLHDQGPNSRSARRIQFTSVDEVGQLSGVVKAYVDEAIEVEAAGLEVGPAPEPEWVGELQVRLDEDPAFKEAFEGLTPGRRREYNLYFADAKQATTRESRVAKYADKILAGKGMRDR